MHRHNIFKNYLYSFSAIGFILYLFFETSQATSLSNGYLTNSFGMNTRYANPTYLVDDVVHYCVANMPGGVPRTSTMALNKATLPLLIKLADQGYKKTLQENKNYLAGLNVYKGKITFKGVAEAFKLSYTPAEKALLE